MRIALFVPCYVDQLKPEVGIATLDLLEACGIQVEYPESQTCCGQPFLSAGELERARALGRHYIDVFADFDAIVTPSGSCAATMRRSLADWVPGAAAEQVAERTFELCEFLDRSGAAEHLSGSFPHRVGLQAGCHALRQLGLGTPTETRGPARRDPARELLSSLEGLELVDLARRDECCGFGGAFSIEEEAVSCRMGLDRLADHRDAGAEVLASTDVSCLLHLHGLARRRDMGLRVMHVAEILAEGLRASTSTSTDATPPGEA
ncbi:MAG: Fe-S oxidoreductase [Deltaproteobacteria bacterium]|jgi:L-lactate dehydrogenase complex protein LldE|nr:Fe-S oxidoreductase [Deltaproteobacteria bacterium]